MEKTLIANLDNYKDRTCFCRFLHPHNISLISILPCIVSIPFIPKYGQNQYIKFRNLSPSEDFEDVKKLVSLLEQTGLVTLIFLGLQPQILKSFSSSLEHFCFLTIARTIFEKTNAKKLTSLGSSGAGGIGISRRLLCKKISSRLRLIFKESSSGISNASLSKSLACSSFLA